MATKKQRKSERKQERNEELGIDTAKQEKLEKSKEQLKKDKWSWIFFLISIICIWIIYKFGVK